MEGPDVGVDGLVVVIEDDQQVGGAVAGVVQSFECESSGQGAVADQGDDLLMPALHPGGFGKAEGGGDGGGGVPRAESVIGTFRPFRESADAIPGAVAFESLPASGQDLVRIRLVPDIKDQFIFRRIIDIVHADDEFDGAQA